MSSTRLCRRRARSSGKPARRHWRRTIPAVVALLGMMLLWFPPAPALPDGGALRTQMAQLEEGLVASLEALCAQVPHDSFTMEGLGEDGLLLTNRPEMAAVAAASGRSLETVFSSMVVLQWETRRTDHKNAPLFPAANGALPRGGEKTELIVSVRCLGVRAGAEALNLSWRRQLALNRLWARHAGALSALFCPPLVPSGQAAAWRSDLPRDLSPLRRDFVECALSLTGQVPYFWGGKSACTGWDMGWNSPALIRASGVPESGTVQPYGLDCSGLVSWAAVSATGDGGAYALIGDGVRQQFSACTPVPLAEVQPGDLLFFSDLSHIGIAAGRNADGTLRVVHCSRSLGGVVLGEDAGAIGFASAGRSALFSSSS